MFKNLDSSRKLIVFMEYRVNRFVSLKNSIVARVFDGWRKIGNIYYVYVSFRVVSSESWV